MLRPNHGTARKRKKTNTPTPQQEHQYSKSTSPHIFSKIIANLKLERAVDGAPSQIPKLKLFTPSTPQSHSWCMTLVTEWKFKSKCFIFFVKIQTKFGMKIFEIDFVNEISLYLTFWPHPKVTSLTLGWKVYSHSVVLIITVNLICLPLSTLCFLGNFLSLYGL